MAPVGAKSIRDASDRLRAVGRELPRWHCLQVDGRAALVDDGLHQEIAVFPGLWHETFLRFFTAVDGAVLCAVAELLWQIQRGGVPQDVALAAQDLARLMRFEPRVTDATGGSLPAR